MGGILGEEASWLYLLKIDKLSIIMIECERKISGLRAELINGGYERWAEGVSDKWAEGVDNEWAEGVDNEWAEGINNKWAEGVSSKWAEGINKLTRATGYDPGPS